MQRNFKRTCSLMILVVMVLGVMMSVSQAQATHLATSPEANTSRQVTTVRVGYVPVMIYAPLYVADAQGYFADEGILIELNRVAGGSEPLAPLATGDLDVVFGGAGAGLFNYAYRNLDLQNDPNFRIVAGVHSEKQPMTSPLVVSKSRYDSGEITRVADLEGGRVAINAVGAATEYWMYQALVLGGVDPTSVEIVAVAFPDVAAALNSESADRIDAAILGEPLVSFAEQEGLVVRLADDFIDGFQATFLYMSNDFIANNREAAVGFVRAYLRAVRDLETPDVWQSDDTAKILEEYTGVPAAINKNAARPYYPVNGTINIANLEALQTYFADQGTLGYDGLLEVTVMLDETLLDEVLADIGVIEEETDSSEPTATAEPGDAQ